MCTDELIRAAVGARPPRQRSPTTAATVGEPDPAQRCDVSMPGSDVPGSDVPGSESAQRAAFAAAYEKLLANRTAAVESIELSSDFGSTRVHASGPADAPAVVGAQQVRELVPLA